MQSEGAQKPFEDLRSYIGGQQGLRSQLDQAQKSGAAAQAARKAETEATAKQTRELLGGYGAGEGQETGAIGDLLAAVRGRLGQERDLATRRSY